MSKEGVTYGYRVVFHGSRAETAMAVPIVKGDVAANMQANDRQW